MLLHNQREGVARLAKCLTGAGWHRHPAAGKRAERQVEQIVKVCLSVTPGERPGLEVQLVRTPGLLGMRVELTDANHRVIPAHHLGSRLSLEHADRALIGGPHTPVRSEDQDQQPGVGDHETRLPLLPGKPDQGRAENVNRQEGEQHGKPGALVNIVLGRGGTIARLEPGGKGKRCRQGAQAEHGQLQ